jgi:hypothetical protein
MKSNKLTGHSILVQLIIALLLKTHSTGNMNWKALPELFDWSETLLYHSKLCYRLLVGEGLHIQMIKNKTP